MEQQQEQEPQQPRAVDVGDLIQNEEPQPAAINNQPLPQDQPQPALTLEALQQQLDAMETASNANTVSVALQVVQAELRKPHGVFDPYAAVSAFIWLMFRETIATNRHIVTM